MVVVGFVVGSVVTGGEIVFAAELFCSLDSAMTFRGSIQNDVTETKEVIGHAIR